MPTTPRGAAPDLPPLEPHRRFLLGLCYRMTGDAQEAEDLVQETFVRALERPPADRTAPIRPWLVRVAMNLSRDALRRRKRRGYPCVWLPVPVEGRDPAEHEVAEARAVEPNPEARYDLAESASYAFLLAMESLTPSQRAVVVLRDAFDYSVQEAASALEISEANVKTTHHRARAAMARYDAQRRPVDDELRRTVQEMFVRLMAAASSGDLPALRALLAPDVRALSDGGGVTFAARAPVVGADKVARMYRKLASNVSGRARADVREVNGLPALVIDDPDARRPNAPRAVVRLELDENGLICELHSILAPRKLERITWAGPQQAAR